MDILILLKWNTNYTGRTDRAPSIIVTIVNFFLNGGEVKGDEFFKGNQFVSQVLLRKLLCFVFNDDKNLYSGRHGDNPMDAACQSLPTVEGGE